MTGYGREAGAGVSFDVDFAMQGRWGNSVAIREWNGRRGAMVAGFGSCGSGFWMMEAGAKEIERC